jgi:Ni,Fe-hydrogenase III large subunit
MPEPERSKWLRKKEASNNGNSERNSVRPPASGAPEPIHLDLVVEDEVVKEAIPNIGFIHRGLEGLAEKRDFNEMVYVAERTCGICSFGTAWDTAKRLKR